MTVADQTYVIKEKTDSRILHLEEDIGGTHSADGLRVSEEVYWEKYYHDLDFRYEWNNGILEEKPMADYLSFEMYSWFFSLLKEYVNAHSIASMIGLEIGFRLALKHKTSIRRPDLAVFLHSNPIDIRDDECTYRGIFDLCIEFLSDSKPQDVTRDTVVKKAEYCRAGVTEYFILDRKGQETAFYRLNTKGRYIPIPYPNGILRSKVLPGFQFRLQDLYDHPDLRERLADSVYNSSILLDYQAEHQERLRLAAMLKKLGIDPDTGQSAC